MHSKPRTDYIIQTVRNGYSLSEAARWANVSIAFVSRLIWLHTHKTGETFPHIKQGPPKGQKRRNPKLEEIICHFRRTKNLTATAKEFKISTATLSTYIKQYEAENNLNLPKFDGRFKLSLRE